MKRALIALSLLLCAAIAAPAVADKGGKKKGGGNDRWPELIQLPPGFQPEGIATWRRHTFFVGSRATGAIYRGSLRTGEGDVLVPGGDGFQATGMKVDRRGRLFVSGAGSDAIRVYDARTGRLLANYPVGDAGFINDVVITRRGAYFTDSQVQQLYFIPYGPNRSLGELRRIQITGDFVYGPGFNANGIAAARGGKTLILVKSAEPGGLFTVDAATGASKQIALSGGDGEVANGDGLLLQGRRLYVSENRDDLNGSAARGVGTITTVKLSGDLTRGRIVRAVTDGDFDTPTTIAKSRGRLYVVNGKFSIQNPPPNTPYEVVRVPKR